MTEKPIKELRVHKALASLPQWDEEDTRFLALVDDIQANGLIEPIKITERGEIVDGRHRWRAAKRMAWTTIPTVTVEDDQVLNLAISSLLARRHYTRGQLAYVAYPLFEDAHREAQHLAVKKLQKGPFSPSPTQLGTGTPKTVEALAARLGVTGETFRQASKLHGIFAKNDDVRAEWEPKILAAEDPIGLGRAIAGIAGQAATPSSKGPAAQRWADSVVAASTRLIGVAPDWVTISAEWRQAARTEIVARLAAQQPEWAGRAARTFRELADLAYAVSEAQADHDPADQSGWAATLKRIAQGS